MNSRRFENLVSVLCSRTSADMDARGRALRDQRLLPIGGRGRHAPDLNVAHVATWIIATCGTHMPSRAAKIVGAFRSLVPVTGTPRAFRNEESFGDAIEAAISSVEAANTLRRVIFWHAHGDPPAAAAEIEWDERGKVRHAIYVPARQAKAFSPDDRGPVDFMNDACGITGGVLCEIARELHESN
jgi:hypothetical protein